MGSIKDRYKITPQQEVYDSIRPRWTPFLMYFHSPEFRSEIVNTDKNGFRHNFLNNQKYTLDSNLNRKCNLLVGGSTVFGDGATSDTKTISSQLSELTGNLWLNFGGRAFNSTQEYLLFSFYHNRIKQIDEVVLFSSINDFVIYNMSTHYSRDFGSFFFLSWFMRAMAGSGNNNKTFFNKLIRLFVEPVLSKKLGKTFPVELVPMADAFKYLKGAFSSQELKDLVLPGNCMTVLNMENRNRDQILLPLENNLKNWKTICDSLNIKLTYVMQPVASWIDRKMTEEEEKIFKILDSVTGVKWNDVCSSFNRDAYRWYADGIEMVCNKAGIKFENMNKLFSESSSKAEWLFIDRVHMTDKGCSLAAEILKEKIL